MISMRAYPPKALRGRSPLVVEETGGIDMSESTAGRPARYVGARIDRVEDPKFLRGRGRYLDDITLPRMRHAAFVRSPFAHARLLGIDVKHAEAVPGVTRVFTGSDLEDETLPISVSGDRPEVKTTSRLPLASSRARHVGDPVAIVVASSRYAAEDAADLVEIDWDPLPGVHDPERALAGDGPKIDDDLDDNNIAHIEGGAGDADAAFAGAARVFSKRFHSARSHGAPLETRGMLASYDPATERFSIWSASQMPHLLRTMIAPLLRIPEGKIQVIAPDVGGGFGYKAHLYPEDVILPAVSRLLGRPIKWIADRFEDLAAGTHSKGMISDFEIAVDKEGTFLGMRGHFISDGGAYAGSFTPLIDSLMAARQLPSLYRVRDLAYVADAPVTNKCPVGAVRGVGWSPAQTARESLIDDVAREMGLDPIEIREKNMLSSEPQVTALEAELDGGSYLESLRRAAETIDYAALRERQRTLRDEGRYLGVGFSPFIEPAGLGTEMAKQWQMTGTFHDRASVSIEPDGSVTVSTGLHSHGQGLETSLAQVTADELGVHLEDVRVTSGDTSRDAWGMVVGASRGAVIGTGSVKLAAGDVREKLLRLAGTLLEASPEDIELYDGKAFLKGAPVRSLSIGEVAGFGYFGGNARPESEEHALSSTRSYDPPQTYSNGCCAVVAEVDIGTGMVTLERVVSVEDCGVMLNPKIVDGQVAGGVAHGIGLALLEEALYDDEGQFLSGSLMDYLYPTTSLIPNIEIVHLETPSPVTLGGVKGMGESGTIAAPAAVVNAVADALSPFGVTIDRVPMTPSYLLKRLAEARRNA
jgi:carbon-monoxide dehydrogenase large subunit